MGYHITLVRSPPASISWEDIATAARGLGWQVDDAVREVWLTDGDRVVARVIHDDSGEPWTKSADEEALAAMIVLGSAVGARARGDEFESYRTVDDWYEHPDDRAVRAAIASGSAAARARRALRGRVWDGFRVVVLAVLVAVFGMRIWTDLR